MTVPERDVARRTASSRSTGFDVGILLTEDELKE